MAKPFFGGIHPNDRKGLTNEKPTVRLESPAQVVLPMSMHIGAPCQPLVGKGDKVRLGQKIGEAPGLNVPVHASVSGTVVAVEPRPIPGGTQGLCVVIENDFEDTLSEEIMPRALADELSGEELTEIIHQAGIAGMGGATFPTHVKISSGLGKVDTLIVNGAECEPYITADDRIMRENPEQIIGGLRVIMKIFGLDSAIVAVEANKPQAVAALTEKAGNGISVRVLKTRYPQGAEKQLIQTLTGRQIPPGQLPAAVGCAVFNVATVSAVYKAVYDGMPLIERIVTVTGPAISQPGNFLARIGTSYETLIQAAGGFTEDPYKVIGGGPMMGIAQHDLSIPIVKGSNAILCLTKSDAVGEKDPACIRCGRCIDVCPMKLMPIYMYMYERKSNVDQLLKFNISDCIECGACTYTCPGRLPLTQSFKTAKQKVNDARAKNA